MNQARAESTGNDAGDDDPFIGEVVDDRFRIESLLGAGAVGRVYRATQLSVERDVAIKVLRGDFRRNPEYQKRFTREARVISGFNHPNIVRLIDFGEQEGGEFSYLVMEMVEGLELGELLDETRLEQRFATEIAYQSAGALVEAHNAEVIHRDLKTENILLVPMSTGGFQAKVLDFGVAFPTDSETRLTSDGEIFGTPAYMSPEQGKGAHVGSGSDLYSLGVILYKMVSGRLPFEAESTLEMMVKRMEEQPPPLSEVTPVELVAGLEQLVHELLAKEPEDRPRDATELRSRIDEIRSRAGWDPIRIDPDSSMETAFGQFVHELSDGQPEPEQDSGGLSADQMASIAPDEEEGLDPEIAKAVADEETAKMDAPPQQVMREEGGSGEFDDAFGSSSGEHEEPSDGGAQESQEFFAPDTGTDSESAETLNPDSQEAFAPDTANVADTDDTGGSGAFTDTAPVGDTDPGAAVDGADDGTNIEDWALHATLVFLGLAAVLAGLIYYIQSRQGGGDDARAQAAVGVDVGTAAAAGQESSGDAGVGSGPSPESATEGASGDATGGAGGDGPDAGGDADGGGDAEAGGTRTATADRSENDKSSDESGDDEERSARNEQASEEGSDQEDSDQEDSASESTETASATDDRGGRAGESESGSGAESESSGSRQQEEKGSDGLQDLNFGSTESSGGGGAGEDGSDGSGSAETESAGSGEDKSGSTDEGGGDSEDKELDKGLDWVEGQ